ncbi:MAG: hypothetical protein U5S82_23370 [Gammaproteobacteria bacterium]|nr:hypothetical protein [Gammaproteobacteria bacterium]
MNGGHSQASPDRPQSAAEVEAIKRRGIRKAVGRRALRELGELVEEHERDERAKRRLVWRLWLPLVVVLVMVALGLVAWRILVQT